MSLPKLFFPNVQLLVRTYNCVGLKKHIYETTENAFIRMVAATKDAKLCFP